MVSQGTNTWQSSLTYYLGGVTSAPSFAEGTNALGFNSHTWQASWTNSVTNCPFEYKIEIFSSNAWRALTAEESGYVALSGQQAWNSIFTGAAYSTPNVAVTIASGNTALDGTTYRIRLQRRSLKTTNTSTGGIFESTITWRHVCHDMPKNAAIVSPATVNAYLFVPE